MYILYVATFDFSWLFDMFAQTETGSQLI